MNLLSLIQVDYLFEFLAALSVTTFGISIVCIPILVARLPRDYFNRSSKAGRSGPTTTGRLLLLLLRNAVGLALLFAGIAMLFLPGQGVITIIIGLVVMSFPRKRLLIRSLTRPHSVQHGLDWIRKKMGKEPFYW